MVTTDVDHCRIVSRGLQEPGPSTSQVQASLAVLQERLARVQALGGVFAGVSLSPEAEALSRGMAASGAVGVLS